jgi:hypothetical protein
MKKLISMALISLASAMSFAQQPVYVKTYVKSDGTIVQQHYRTAPNNTVIDNWSTYPNVNPYTGAVGTRYINYLELPVSICNTNNSTITPIQTSSYPVNNSFRPNDLMRTNNLFKPAF